MASFLTEGLILNILHRLPVKTLLRCTSVCRSWYFLITSPQFIHSHLNFTAASKKNAPFLLFRRLIRNSECYDLHSDDQSFTGIDTLDFPFWTVNSFFTIVGSCNGLLCLSDDRVYYVHTIILWNPSVKKSVLLPKPNLIYNSYGTSIQCLGFGFDPVASDFKVIRITYLDCVQGPAQVELCRLSTRVWQNMSFLGLDYVINNRSRQAFVNGAIHWVAGQMNSCDLILVFDVCHEMFREMMLPDGLVDDGGMRSKDLVVYMDSLALILWNESGAEPGFCVWVMKEYGVKDSWTKHLSFGFSDFGGGYVRPLWVRRHGEVLAVQKDGLLISYSTDGAEVTDLGVQGSGSEEYWRSIHVDCYKESLVLLERGPCPFNVVTRNQLPSLHLDEFGPSGEGSLSL